ncbi:hypothetical protein [Flavisolibacter ginsengisoli]|jgi:hypothetical protein|uniref:Uncharacterized protein n=1 Tax=Flavisolibacter ginsengisoli DSM 18119 TaxID=1121884 RepID=A0A1M5BDY2_9BACT|nr:hypothetical protein [Flavisolibacter ginsengisoli]SHF40666.1 hypothetical protein SAMN02745131_02538 [Flavisolibacter ginsengisoli DSM 18119]
MLNEIIDFYKNKFPLKIIVINWDEYILNICGEGWTFNTTSCWRIINQRGLYGSDDKEVETYIKNLEGNFILKIEHLSNLKIDLSFVLSDKTILQVFCSSYFEPWVFRIDNHKTFVAYYDPLSDM